MSRNFYSRIVIFSNCVLFVSDYNNLFFVFFNRCPWDIDQWSFLIDIFFKLLVIYIISVIFPFFILFCYFNFQFSLIRFTPDLVSRVCEIVLYFLISFSLVTTIFLSCAYMIFIYVFL